MQIKIKSLIAISIVLLVACSCKAKESSTFNDIPDEVPLYQAVQTDAKRIGILKRGESYEVQKEESISFTDEIGGYSESFSWILVKKSTGDIGWTLKNILNPNSKSEQDDPIGRWVSLGAKFPQDLVGFLNLEVEKSKVLVNPYAGVGYLKYENPKYTCSSGTCSISVNGQLILKFSFLKTNTIKIIFSAKVVGDGILPDAQVKESDLHHILEEGSILYRL
ncbi:hypothetical protein [Leptospira santarosai]|uniref:Putative lipoprotein n=1 Tax=Leptospira santarosai serovar Arenal str. MAVJ 401 TaxID=1049976 RepID=M6JDK5_9LEPT|nr:hypothetical protein [Leptospira santarosai]ASV11349.1 hypothetical protein B2G51_05785 [Leptospira santarosai]EMM77920.1 putative lipoprotein [Leptospira santarosai str. 2000030832]EMN19726.1 putative lipoprotein [Leptospira santarosai serovar Arenal str. MAVJ 401]MDI7167049.1 hypothetical protein [Leptospira santarosai]MDI7184123.1 hypothetical protein [Leptospira santarosai]